MATKMNITDKRTLLDRNAGKFIAVEWIKADGSKRQAVVKHMQHDMFSGGHASVAQVNNMAINGNKPEMYTCVDTTNGKWVNINLRNLLSVKCGSTNMTFEPEDV